MSQFHTSVLPKEAINALQVKLGEHYIDATLGGGGHTKQILDLGGKVLAFDVDNEAIDYVHQQLGDNPNLNIAKANFSKLKETANEFNINQVSGVLFDLGVSSWQLTEPQRGFTFSTNSNLDMRMDQELSVQAKDLLAALGEKELTLLFTKYGDEPKARKIAQTITRVRKTHPITTSNHLAGIIEQIYRGHKSHLHPATKVFQALRIAVNDELGSLETALPQAFDLLKPGGRLVVISFHSGEDRIVKQYAKKLNQNNQVNLITKKPITPTTQELNTNPRSRSAKLRVIEKK